MDDTGLATLKIPERSIPVPSSISAEAMQVLSSAAERGFVWADYPADDDRDGWESYARLADGNMRAMFSAFVPNSSIPPRLTSATGIPYYKASSSSGGSGRRTVIHYHGGALVAGGGDLAGLSGWLLAESLGVEVLAADYRMPPAYRYPVPLEDCFSFYKDVIAVTAPQDVIVHGASAGGNLAVATLLRAQEEGVAMPAALILETPELDLTESGDTFQTNRYVDSVLQRSLMPINKLYAGDADLGSPLLSPLFGDFMKGFPQTLVTAGTRDMFLSNAVRMLHRLRACRIPVELLVYEAMPHGGFFGAPEDSLLRADLRRFAETVWQR